MQPKHRMLVISKDSFFTGLLTGYCVANQIDLVKAPIGEPVNLMDITSRYKLIILDSRKTPIPIIDAHLEQIKRIRTRIVIPVCTIYNSEGRVLEGLLPWVDYCQDKMFIENLDDYLNRYVLRLKRGLIDRRKKERRTGHDRRDSNGDITYPVATDEGGSSQERDGIINRDVLGVFEIDNNSHAVYLKGRDLELTSKEYKLFVYLAGSHERVCNKEEIIEYLWPDRERANKSDLYQYMHLLRKKVEQDPDNPHWVVTVKGVGYKLRINE